MNTKTTPLLYEVGKIVLRNQGVNVDRGETKSKFDACVRLLAEGRGVDDLCLEEIHALRTMSNRHHDRLPEDVAVALGLEKSSTYADAIYLAQTKACEEGESGAAEISAP